MAFFRNFLNRKQKRCVFGQKSKFCKKKFFSAVMIGKSRLGPWASKWKKLELFGKNTILTIFGFNLSKLRGPSFGILPTLQAKYTRPWSAKFFFFFFQILIFDQKRIFLVFCSINLGKMPWIENGVCCREHMVNPKQKYIVCIMPNQIVFRTGVDFQIVNT